MDCLTDIRKVFPELCKATGYDEAITGIHERNQSIVTQKRTLMLCLRELGFSYHQISGLFGIGQAVVVHHCKLRLTKLEELEFMRCKGVIDNFKVKGQWN